jgi:hypothetical protein
MMARKVLTIFFVSSLLFIGCKPDLVVKRVDVTWDATEKKAEAEVANIGNKDAGNFLVYFNGEEDPISPNHKPQVRKDVPGLAKGDSIILEADFAPLAHPDNNNLGNVYKILVIADPKNQIEEKNENNNEMEAIIPAMGCVDFEQQTLGITYHVGDIFIDVGVEITIQQFQWGNGQWTNGGFAEIEILQRAGHQGKDIHVNNVNLDFEFGSPQENLSVSFGEYGGNLNINVNGAFRNFNNFSDINGTTLGGVTFTVTNGFGNDKGILSISGTISSFTIGGQELWIDHVCPGSN